MQKSSSGSDATADAGSSAIPAETLIAMHKDMLRLRATEECIAERYCEQEMRTPTHLGTGQEAIAVGVARAMREGDVAYSHHRCHNHYLACGGSVYGLATELYGRADGCSGGRGGSVHLTSRDTGFVVSSAIVGETVAVATGSALAFKMDGARRVAVSFFGEATFEEGVIYEAMNYAAIHALPILFVCENNLYSTESPLHTRQPAGTELTRRAESFTIPARQVDGNDVAAVHQAAGSAVARARAGEGPGFIECMTYRWREHVGPMFDWEARRTYRSRAELKEWMERCPLKRSANRLVEHGHSSREELASWEKEIAASVAADFDKARQAPWPDASTLFDNA